MPRISVGRPNLNEMNKIPSWSKRKEVCTVINVWPKNSKAFFCACLNYSDGYRVPEIRFSGIQNWINRKMGLKSKLDKAFLHFFDQIFGIFYDFSKPCSICLKLHFSMVVLPKPETRISGIRSVTGSNCVSASKVLNDVTLFYVSFFK